jgi:oxygen-independent coproporphyrinogen-3 oxidase
VTPAAGVYVHLPFCPYLCPYCDFAKWPLRESQARRYLAALEREIAAAPAARARTLFLGGGTPNTYRAADLARAIGAVRTKFALPFDAETTVEINPDLALCEELDAYRAAGVNRLSIGAQSFDPAVLRVLGRRHDGAAVGETVRRARRAGFENVSLDLIFGAPGETPESWRRTLAAALELEPEHVSAYGLTVEEGTPYADWFAREPAAFPDDSAGAQFYGDAIDALEAAGFEHYELSNFARPGFRCAHNLNYWANGDYLGFGVSAASHRDGTRRANARDIERYCELVEAAQSPCETSETLQGSRKTGEAVMLALRTAEGVDYSVFANRYGVDVPARYAAEIERLRSAGMLAADAGRLRLTREGRFLANDVCAAFLVQ